MEDISILIFFTLLLFINLLFVFRRLPLVAFPIALFSFYIGATQFLTETDIPYNPHATVFFVIICLSNMLSNVLYLREE